MFFRLERIQAPIAQLGERQTEDLKVPGSIPGPGTDALRQDGLLSTARPLRRKTVPVLQRRCLRAALSTGQVCSHGTSAAWTSEVPGPAAGIGGCPLGGTFRTWACARTKCTAALTSAPRALARYTQCDGHASLAAIAQLGERQAEDLKVPGSILGLGIAPGPLEPPKWVAASHGSRRP